ncbi:MAG: squalene/phytoene synthase family protein [Rhodobacteraceae bacterium]|nr:squalene/phytoene synthase family protein [Paracoccaceae bacterium]
MTPAACADLVRRGDPDRFRATMAAPPAARPLLWPLYAYNLELARAAWASAEPLVCRMRLQWWIDTVSAMPGAARRPHEVAGPLHDVVAARALPADLLAGMAEARLRDTDDAPFADAGALLAHLDATSGNLMWAAALALGAPPAAEPAVRDFARGAGLAAWLSAAAALASRGRRPLPAPVPELAAEGRAAIARARAAGRLIPPPVRPALYPGWMADALLAQAARHPARVTEGRLALPEIARRAALLRLSLTGRF